jgi:hypothetical protein
VKILIVLTLSVGSAAAQCPVSNIQLWETLLLNDYHGGGPVPALLNLKFTNSTTKMITGIKFSVAWMDAVGDIHSVSEMPISDSKLKPAAAKKLSWRKPVVPISAEKGWLVAPSKVLYDDGSIWQMSPSERGCFGQYHTKLAEIPKELVR